MKKIVVALVAATFVMSNVAYARDTIRIVGSSTVYPFTTTVAENFGKKTGVNTPVVESTGTGGGIKLFCAGTGETHPDAVNASRAIKDVEKKDCAKNGVTPVEISIGFDAIVIAMAKEHEDMGLSTEQLYRALAKFLIIDGKIVENPYNRWNDIDPALSNGKIEVLGPPPTSGTRDSFVELVIEKECKKAVKSSGLTLSEDDEKSICKTMREDGAFIEAGENDNLIVQKIKSNPNALGIFGFSFLEENLSGVKAATVNGVAPEYDAIKKGDYPISRLLFVYFKKEHIGVVPNLDKFMEEYQSDEAIGEEGYLTEKGLISLK